MAKQEELDNDDIESNMDDVDESEEQDTEQEEEEYTPPSKEELKAIRTALEKANTEAKNYRLQVKNLKAAEKTAKESSEDEDEKKVSAAKKEVEDFYKPRLVRSAVKVALKEAGLSGTPDRLLKLVDVTDFEIDENGDVEEGDLDRTVESLKNDYPELFTTTRRTPRIDGSREATGTKQTSKSSADLLLDRIKNGPRR